MNIKSPPEIIQTINKAKVISVDNHLTLSSVTLQFPDDDVEYCLNYLTENYSDIIDRNQLNYVTTEKIQMDSGGNPVDVIQYEMDVPITSVWNEHWCITEAIKLGLVFYIYDVRDVKATNQLKELEKQIYRMTSVLDENRLLTDLDLMTHYLIEKIIEND
jgi:hypothetical protein